MRSQFTRELRELSVELSEMGAMVDRVMLDTLSALRNQDLMLARRIYRNDYKINAQESKIEQMCFNLIALQQPMASDLRAITAALKAVTDLERTGDQCADICEILLTNPGSRKMPVPQIISRMMEKARDMFAGALDSFLRRDADLARDVCERDDEVDELFSRAILELSQVLQDDRNMVSQATDYMFIAKYVERMADHATNIAEWAIYTVTGSYKDLNNHLFPGDMLGLGDDEEYDEATPYLEDEDE